MAPSDEQPSQQPPPRAAAGSAHLEAHAADQAMVHQAGRDLHLHYQDGVRGAQRVAAGAKAQECPYPGLASFGSDQVRWFFGRDELTAELIARLDARRWTGGVQVVMAPSGAGKSSLLHAGLLPQLANGALPRSDRWPIRMFTPTGQPLAALATQIGALTGANPVSLAGQWVADPHRAGAVPRGRIRDVDPDSRLVLVVDQFEELFTLCPDDRQRRTFVELLTQIAAPQSVEGSDPYPAGLVVVGVRADFYAACVNYSHLRTAMQDSPLVVGPMSSTELREAILFPARAAGLDIEPGLVELLLRDLGDSTDAMRCLSTTEGYEAGRLPLLAHALRTTWQQRHGHTLTVTGYRNTGGIQRAVATTAERVFAGLYPASQHAARILFLRLIRIGDGTEDTRRRVPHQDLLWGLAPGIAWPVVDAFTQARLLTRDHEKVEITHEALLRVWPRLRQWVDTDRAGNLIRQELEDAAATWARDRGDTAGLYRGSRLETVRTWASSNTYQGGLSPVASAFLTTSTQQERRTVRFRRAMLVMLSVLALVASGAAAVAFDQSATARQERNTAIYQQTVARADLLRSTDASLAAQLDLAAYRMRPEVPARYTNLVSTGNTALSTPLTGHTDRIISVAFSPDGRTLATGSLDQKVRLWGVADPARSAPLGELPGHTDAVSAVAFSPDGDGRRILATGGTDPSAWLWDVADPSRPERLGELPGHTDRIISVVFSPDGRTLAAGSFDGTLRLWDVADPAQPELLRELSAHTRPEPSDELPARANAINAMAFSPDGDGRRILATGGADRTVRLWDVTDPAQPELLHELPAHTHEVNAVTFSPDGRTLATGSAQLVRLWDMAAPARPELLGEPLAGHTNAVFAVAFSPDGDGRRILATGGADRTVRLWDVTVPARPELLGEPLAGHTNSVNAVAFSPDGRTLATGSDDQSVRLWNMPHVLMGHTDWVNAAAFRTVEDGRRILATGSADRTVRLWDVTDPAGPELLSELPGHTDSVFSVAFSPDGDGRRILATGSADRSVRLWDMADPARPGLLVELTGYTDAVHAVAFSPDGRALATGTFDGMLWLWDVTNPAQAELLSKLPGHTSAVFAVAFSSDGDGRRILATGSADQSVRLWDVTDPARSVQLGKPLTGHTNSIFSVAFSPDGRTLATGSDDQSVRLWNVADPAQSRPFGEPLTGHAESVNAVAFSPDGRTLATGSDDHTARLWQMNVDHAIERICTTAKNTLTEEKWKQYVSPDQRYTPPCQSE